MCKLSFVEIEGLDLSEANVNPTDWHALPLLLQAKKKMKQRVYSLDVFMRNPWQPNECSVIYAYHY